MTTWNQDAKDKILSGLSVMDVHLNQARGYASGKHWRLAKSQLAKVVDVKKELNTQVSRFRLTACNKYTFLYCLRPVLRSGSVAGED